MSCLKKKKNQLSLRKLYVASAAALEIKPLLSCSQEWISSACIYMFPFLIDIHQLDAIQAQHLTPKSRLQILAHQNWKVYTVVSPPVPGKHDCLGWFCPQSHARWLSARADAAENKSPRPTSSVADVGFTKAGKSSLFCVLDGGKCVINCAVCSLWFRQYSTHRLH